MDRLVRRSETNGIERLPNNAGNAIEGCSHHSLMTSDLARWRLVLPRTGPP